MDDEEGCGRFETESAIGSGSVFISDRAYQRLVAAVLNSPPDKRVGCQPYQLLEHLRNVFEFDDDKHNEIVNQEEQYIPQYELCVKVMEAKGLAECLLIGNPHCLLTLTNQPDENPSNASGVNGRRSPRVSRRPSILHSTANGSDSQLNLDAPHSHMTNVHYTQCILNPVEVPCWDETFNFSMGEKRSRYLNVYVVKNDVQQVQSSTKKTKADHHPKCNRSRRESEIRSDPPPIHHKNSSSVFKRWWPNLLTGPKTDESECTSWVFIPLKEFAIDQWHDKSFNLSHSKRNSLNCTNDGSIHLKFRISVKARDGHADQPECENLTIVELIDIIRQFHYFNALRQMEEYESSQYSGDCMDCTDAILEQTLIANNISSITRRIISLGLCLQWNELYPEIPLSPQAFPFLIEQLDMSCALSPTRKESRVSLESWENSPICTEIELEFLRDAVVGYMEHYVKNLQSQRAPFFPPALTGGLVQFYKKMELPIALCKLAVWEWGVAEQPEETLQHLIEDVIAVDVSEWLTNQLRAVNTVEASSELSNASALADMFDVIGDSVEGFLHGFDAFFQKFNVRYTRIVLECIDKQLVSVCQDSVNKLTAAVMCSHRVVTLELFSKTSLRLYQSIKRLCDFFTTQMDDRSSSIDWELSGYEAWFHAAAVYWTHTWKDVSGVFIHRAMRKDRDLERAAEDVDLAESAINVLAICKGMCDDFCRLDFTSIDTRLMCTIKLTDIICDHMVGYARHLHRTIRKMKSQTHDNILLQIRATNSIEHVGIYLEHNLPRFLDYYGLFQLMKASGEAEVAKETLNKLMASACRVTHGLASELVVLICEQKQEMIEKHCAEMTMSVEQYNRRLRSYMRQVFAYERADVLLNFLEKVAISMKGSLLPSLTSGALEELWSVTQRVVLKQLETGQPSEYYRQITEHCQLVRELIESMFIDEDGKEHLRFEPQLLQSLHMNSQSTEELILEYYAQLADRTDTIKLTADTCVVHIQCGYIRVTNQQMSVVVRVISGSNFPVLDSYNNSCDPYVRLELFPSFLFPRSTCPAKSTSVLHETRSPSWDQAFYFDVPEAAFFTHGATLCISGLDHDLMSHNDLAGQAYIHLARIPKIDGLSQEDLSTQAIALPLTIPPNNKEFEPFQVLKERSNRDAEAKQVYRYQKYISDYKMLPPSAGDETESLCSSGFQEHLHDIISLQKNRFKQMFQSNKSIRKVNGS